MSTVKAINLQHPTAANANIVLTNSERIGIGTSSPAFKTEIVSGYNDGLHLKDTTGTVYGGMFTESGTMALVTRSNHALRIGTNDTTRMSIDSSGRITSPYQPRFSAYNSASGSQTPTFNTWGSWNTLLNNWNTPRWVADVNVGNSFNTSNGLFTAPVTGYYLFTLGMAADIKNSSYMAFWKNGASTPPFNIMYEYNAAASGSSYYVSGTLSYTFYMTAGDTMTGGGYFASNSWNSNIFANGYLYITGQLVG